MQTLILGGGLSKAAEVTLWFFFLPLSKQRQSFPALIESMQKDARIKRKPVWNPTSIDAFDRVKNQHCFRICRLLFKKKMQRIFVQCKLLVNQSTETKELVTKVKVLLLVKLD